MRRDLTAKLARLAMRTMGRTRIVHVDPALALRAADLSLEQRLAMADAIILATARLYDAELVTSDRDFESIPGVTFLPKPAPDLR